VPPIIIAEKKAKLKQVFMLAIAIAALAQLALIFLQGSVWGVAISLLFFFISFNVLEATQPSIVSKIAPTVCQRYCDGVFSSVQFLGHFLAPQWVGY